MLIALYFELLEVIQTEGALWIQPLSIAIAEWESAEVHFAIWLLVVTFRTQVKHNKTLHLSKDR